MNVEDNAIDIVVAGTDKEMIDDFRHGITEDEERAHVIEIHESDYDGFVKVGFDSRANLKDLEKDLELLKENITQTSEEVRKLEIQKRKLQKSFSWRLTYPIRLSGAIIKFFKRS